MTIKGIMAIATVAGLAIAGSASAQERWVDIVNEGGSAIWSVQISDIASPDWGPDLLGQHVIYPGEMMTVEPHYHRGYCRFDVRVTYETGRNADFFDVNLCEAWAVYASDNGYTYVAY